MNQNKEQIKKQHYVAIDIAKSSLAVFCDSFKGSFSYTEAGLGQLLGKINAIEQPIVVCQASGGYERKLMDTLHANNIAVALVNPSRVRAFAKSEGIKAKTDPIDAKMLLQFAQSKDPRPTPPPSPQKQTLEALMDRRSQLTETLTREKNRLDKCAQSIRSSILKMITILEEEIDRIDEEIEQLIKEDTVMGQQSSTMQLISGVGKITAWSILAYLGEIIELSRNELVALAGVAPFNKDSGKYKGKRRIEGGRAKVRNCLYMAAQSAAVHNEHIKTYVDGLRARGKPYKCAIVAAIRKLLIYIQSLLKDPEKAAKAEQEKIAKNTKKALA